jgi:hypothetical protein
MKVNATPVDGEDTFWGYIVRLASNNYTPTTFAQELQTRLRENTGSNTFTVATYENSGIIIQNTNQAYQWKLLTDDDLLLNRFPGMSNISYDRNNLRSANDIIQNLESDDVVIGGTGSSVQTYESGFLNLNWISNLYLCSPNLGSFNTIFAGTGAGLGNNIIKKIPVTAGMVTKLQISI